MPEIFSNPRDFALPILGTVVPTVDLSVPLVAVAKLYKLTDLKASTSPETKPISGVPKILSTFTKFFILNLVLLLFWVLKSLALSTSKNVVVKISASYPFT